MAVIDGRMAKRARRSNKISADKYDFYTFPVPEARSKQPFRVAVRDFLSNHARVTFPPSTLFSSLMTWQILLSAEDPTTGSDLPTRFVTLDVVEEDVTKSSRSVYCDHCRVVGWSGHPVCRKRYHFIIRSRESKGVEDMDLQKSCSRCGESTQLSPDCSSCGWCESALGADEATNWVYSQLDNQTHLLHGVIHYNGFAHLLSLNGIEGGSGFLTGGAIMDFWDRLCSALGVNKASVMDVSMKYGMDYRLLHAVTKGCSWYGEWGYEFKAGSYALTRDAYQSAVETLSAMSVAEFLYKGRMQRTQLHSIVGFYQLYSCSQLGTLRDLFSFLLQLIDKNSSDKKLDKNSSDKKLASQRSAVECRWSSSDVERVQQALIKILKAAGGVQANWITRWALKRSIYKTASPVLLDYCLKHLDGVLADGESQVVISRCNHITNDYEYRLEPVNSVNHLSKQEVNYPAVEHVKRDLKYLYDNLLHPQTMATPISQRRRNKMTDAATKILDCKHFIKDYLPTIVNPSAINLWCTAQLSDQNKEFPALPPELLVLPLNSTVGDLKTEAAKAFQEVYAMFKKFEVEDLLGYGYIDDSITLKFLVGQSGVVRIKGRCSTKHGYLRYRMERGLESWKVDCMCGANDDDGERMLACDVCSVWHHTRCAGIENSDALPSKFHCFRCIGVYSKSPRQSITKHGSSQMSQSGFVCRGESAAIGSGSNISVPLSVG